jgi:predicted MPP superfamily phosphohydrolase
MRPWYAFVVFFLVITAVVGGVHYYLYARLVKAAVLSPALERTGALVFVALAVLTPMSLALTRFLPPRAATVLAYVGYSWLGLAILLFFLSVGSEVLRLGAFGLSAVNVLPDDPERRTFLGRALSFGVTGMAGALGVYGVSSARGEVMVERVKVRLERFPSALGGFRVVQLSDVHIGPTLGGDWLRAVVEKVNALEPDLVAITGDLVDGSVKDLADDVAPLKDLRAKHGVFFVTGNHEYYSGADEWIAYLRTLGVRVLRNEHVVIGEGEASFELAGVDDWRAKGFGGDHGPDLARALAGHDPSREVVLLAHQPKQAPDAAKAGVGLQLSGHTHGGQIFPWNYFVKLDQPFIAGLDREGDMLVYTSRGTGYWGPPMRVGAPPEITLLELERAA